MGDTDSLTQQISRRLSAAITLAKGAGSMETLRRRLAEGGCVVREQELSRWQKGPERGYPIPDLDRLPALAAGLGVTLAWLMLGVEGAPQKTIPPGTQRSAPPPRTADSRQGASPEENKRKRRGA